jgi:hypothetical protein
MKRTYIDYLKDMLENANRGILFSLGMDYQTFIKDEKSIYAVIRAVEIIGEATRNIPEEIRAKYPEIPWRDVSNMRNKLVHRYFGIDFEIIWKTIQEDLPFLISSLEDIIKRETNSSNQ